MNMTAEPTSVKMARPASIVTITSLNRLAPGIRRARLRVGDRGVTGIDPTGHRT